MASKLVVGLAFALSLGSTVAQGQTVPVAFVKVAEVKRLLTEGKRILFVDVRSLQEYLARHIQGAVSIPLNAIEERYREIPRQGFVVLY